MRKFIFIFGMMAFALLAKAQETLTISWLTDEKRDASYTAGSSVRVYSAVMEFYQEDLVNFNSTAKSIVGIDQIQVYVDSASFPLITNYNVIILKGKDIASATQVVKQSVPIANLVRFWNTVNLNTVYDVDLSQKLYIGYELTVSAQAYPLASAKGTNPKQSWMRSGTNPFENLVTDYGFNHVFLIKANAIVEDSPDDRMSFVSLNMGDKYRIQGENVTVSGTVKNLGKNPLTSFSVYYEVDGTTSAVETVSGLNIASGATTNFNHPATHALSAIKSYNFKVTISSPNAVEDGVIGDSTRNMEMLVFTEKVQRVVLHEVFTSSTCTYCKGGNESLTKVLDAKDANKWACVKYQYNFPGSGDPYYTSEVTTREDFYGGIPGVPHLFCDGNEFDDHPGYYTTGEFDRMANIPAAAKTTSSASVNVNNQKVDFNVTINPVTTLTNPNLRLFAAIVEKETFNNKKTNGETVFHYVLKKFITNVNGENINFTVNTPITRNYSYTFKGSYRLPANSNSPINHNSEHSVEDHNALLVVYWIQDIVTKEVFQAGKADPNPSYQSRVSVEEIVLTSGVAIYPNPANDNLNILTADPIKEVVIHNLLGQKLGVYNGNVTTIPVSDLAKGMYVITIKTENRVFNQKFVKE